MPSSWLKERSGQALVESLIALTALTIGFTGVVSLLSRSLSLNRTIADQYVGTYLASEGIEIVKNMIDSDTIAETTPGDNFGDSVPSGDWQVDIYSQAPLAVPNSDVAIKFDPATKTYAYSGPNDTSFVRIIRVSRPSPDEVQVNSIVTWRISGGGQLQVDLEDHFFNWRKASP